MRDSQGADMTRHCRRNSVLDDDNLLWDILLRLSPQPSSLPRVSAVCKQWCRLVTDSRFLPQFYAHHRKPPLLGIFQSLEDIVFTPVQDPSDRMPTMRFNFERCSGGRHEDYDVHGFPRENNVLGCHHGRILVGDSLREEVTVCDPITGEQSSVAVPLEFQRRYFNGTVLCADGDQGHVHGTCHSRPFKVVLAFDHPPLVCVYSSKTGTWGNLISTAAQCYITYAAWPGTLVGNALYWLCTERDHIVEFDLEEQTLAVIGGPPNIIMEFRNRQIIQAEDGVVGVAALSYPCFHMWQRNVKDNHVATWVPWKNIEMHNILGLPPQTKREGFKIILGYSKDTDDIFILVDNIVYMVQLNSMQSKRLHEINSISNYHPLTSFCTPGTTIKGGSNGQNALSISNVLI